MTTTTTRQAATGTGSALWAPDRRGPTIGIVLLITLIAFEDMGVNTAMPRIVADLHGGAMYAWPFVAFLGASVATSVLSGRLCDRRGPVPGMLLGPAVFMAGLVVSGTAVSMPMLLVGRMLQGVGAGTQGVAVMVLIAAVYPEHDRPAAYGALSTAWVVPALVGPAISGLVTEHLSWRLVFLGLVPLVMVGLAALVPVLRRLPAQPRSGSTPRRGLAYAAVGAAVGLAGLNWAAGHPSWLSLGIGVVAGAVLVPSLLRLLPAGTLRAARGLPVTILARGLMSGAYFAVIAYVPLTMIAVHGYSPSLAGVPLTVGALGWSAAAMWQARHPDVPRARLLRVGFVFLAVGVLLVAVTAPSFGPAWLVMPALAIGGAGMGLGISAQSMLTLSLSPAEERGFNSSALQISDMLGQVVLVSVGGVLLTALASTAHPTAAVLPLDLAMGAVALAGALVAARVNARR